MKLRELAIELTDLFYPSLCPACDEVIMRCEDRLCLDCLFKLPFTDMHDQADNIIEQRLWGKLDLVAATSLFYFRKGGRVQHMLHQLKYHGNRTIGVKLGEMLADELKRSKRFADIDVVVPVPLHPDKLSIRGYNQCDVIAEGMAKAGLTVRNDALRRSEHNPSQTRKGVFKRWENVSGIFSEDNISGLEGKHLLLIDDVITSGSTLEACALPLQGIADVRVSVAAIACAE